MGAINYGTSEYITLGVRPDRYYDEKGFDMGLYEYEAGAARQLINRYSSEYFLLTFEWGYHEGFYLDVKDYYKYCYDLTGNGCINDYKERKEINKEITRIKALMLKLVDMGFVACYPGWCTGYADAKETRKEINEAIKEMRREVKETPTYNQYERLKKGA